MSILAVWVCLAAAEPPAGAPAPQEAPAVEERALSLVEAVEEALRNNLDLEISRYDPLVAEQDVVAGYAAFDLVARASTQYREVTQPTASALSTGSGDPLMQRTIQDTAGFSHTLPLGLRYDLSATANRTSTNSTFALLDPRWDTAISLAVTMPFLRGNSRDIGAPLLLARRRHEASLHDFDARMQDLVVQVENAYWALYAAQQEVVLREQSLETAQELLRLNRERFDAGLDPRIEVTRAEAEVATRVEALITARNALADAEDQLLLRTDPAELRRGGRVALRLLDAPPEEARPLDVAALVEQLTDQALDGRPEIASLRLQERAQEIAAEQARIEALPRLDLTGGITRYGLSGNWDDSFDTLLRDEFPDYSIGLALEWPLGNFAAAARRTRALLEKRRLQVRLAALEDGIRVDVRRAVRTLEAGAERMAATAASLELSRQQYDMEEARRRHGLETSLAALQALEGLELARLNHLRARIDYQNARVALERAAGTVLANRHILVEDHLQPRGTAP